MDSEPFPTATAQLAAIVELHHQLTQHGIPYWLFGGWAVDAHAGRISRQHDDIDIAVRRSDLDHADTLLTDAGWTISCAAEGYRTFRREGVVLDLAWFTDSDPAWPPGSFASETGVLRGHRIHVIGRDALLADKAAALGDPAKDSADVATLRRLTRTELGDEPKRA